MNINTFKNINSRLFHRHLHCIFLPWNTFWNIFWYMKIEIKYIFNFNFIELHYNINLAYISKIFWPEKNSPIWGTCEAHAKNTLDTCGCGVILNKLSVSLRVTRHHAAVIHAVSQRPVRSSLTQLCMWLWLSLLICWATVRSVALISL